MDWLNYVILGVYVLAIASVAYYTKNKGSNLNDFLLAGRGVGGWMIAFSYGTAYFSAVVFVGYAGRFGASFGLAAVWIGVGNALLGSFLAWKVLAKRTKNMTEFLDVKTMPEFFERRYYSKNIKLVSTVIIFLFLIPYSASVYTGIGYLFEAVFGIDFIWCVLIMAALTALYIFFGGFLASVLTDFLQGFIMLAGVILMIFILLANPHINFGEGLAKLAESGKGLIPAGSGGGLLSSPAFNVIIITLLTSFGTWGMPQIIHKYYAVKDGRSIRRAAVISSVFALIVASGAYFFGALAGLYPVPDEIGADNRVPYVVMQAMPAGITGFIVVLLLAASMSTLAAMSLSGASAVAVDMYKGYIDTGASDKRVRNLLRIFSLVFIALSALLAVVQFDAIVTLMSFSWGVLAGCFLGPYLYGLYSKKVSRAAVYSSFVSGITVTVALIFVLGGIYPSPDHSGLEAVIRGGAAYSPLIGVISMAVSVIIVPLVSAFTKPPRQSLLTDMFEAAEKKI